MIGKMALTERSMQLNVLTLVMPYVAEHITIGVPQLTQ